MAMFLKENRLRNCVNHGLFPGGALPDNEKT
jgi:hypothetical protein